MEFKCQCCGAKHTLAIVSSPIDELKQDPIDEVFNLAHEQIASPYVPRMNREWIKVNGAIKAVSVINKQLLLPF